MPQVRAAAAALLHWIDEADPRTLRRVIAATVFLFLFTLITHGHFAGSGDAVHYMMTARSIAFDGDLDVGNDYADPHNLIFDGGLEAGAHARPGRDGGLYPVHDVGLPILAAPGFAAAYALAELAAERLPQGLLQRARLSRWILLRQLVSLGMILVTCALAVRAFDAFLLLGGTARASFPWAILWVLSPPVLSLGFAFFTEVPTALIALCLYLESRRPSAPGPVRAVILGFATGFLLLIHAKNVALVLALGLLLFRRATAGGRRPAAALAAGLAAALGLRTLLTWRMWGTLITTPHASFAPTPLGEALVEMPSRLLAWCFDVEHGLLLWAPVYLLVPAGLLLLRRRARGVFLEIAGIVSLQLLVLMAPMINRHGWRGGWSPAARFLVPIAPFLAVAVLYALMSCRSWITTALVLAQCALDGVYWAHPMLLWEDGDGHSRLLEVLGGVLPGAAAWWPSWTWPAGPLAVACLVAVASWTALTLLLLRRAAPVPEPVLVPVPEPVNVPVNVPVR